MRNLNTVALLAMAVALMASACGTKPTDALKKAEDAIERAEKAGAPRKAPEPYQRAKSHLAAGKEQSSLFRYNLAACEYEAAHENADAAADLAGCETARAGLDLSPDEAEPPSIPEREIRPGPSRSDSCCLELELCNEMLEEREDKIASMKKPKKCPPAERVVTRVVHEDCPPCRRKTKACPKRPECPEPTGEGAERGPPAVLMGTLSIEGPGGIREGEMDYSLTVRYERARLEGPSAAADDYRILLDVAEVDPPQVEVVSPMADFQPLGKNDGKWKLKMNVPETVEGPVTVGVQATLWNPVTNHEKRLAPLKITVPNLAGCPECEPAAPAPAAPAKAPKEGNGWAGLIIALILGLAAGLALGFIVFGRRSRSSLG